MNAIWICIGTLDTITIRFDFITKVSVYQNNYARAYRSQVDRDWFSDDVYWMEWSPYSPELNPIEKLWAKIELSVWLQQVKCETLTDLLQIKLEQNKDFGNPDFLQIYVPKIGIENALKSKHYVIIYRITTVCLCHFYTVFPSITFLPLAFMVLCISYNWCQFLGFLMIVLLEYIIK